MRLIAAKMFLNTLFDKLRELSIQYVDPTQVAERKLNTVVSSQLSSQLS